ncbi:MAG: phage terminase large subunit [Mesorhizobium sp.]
MSQRSSIPLQVNDRRYLDALLRENLSIFIQRCYNELEPSSNYRHNWHVDAIAHALSEVAAGRCKRLVITLPPRSLKSLSASIAFSAWLLGRDPRRKIICASYGKTLTEDLAGKHRRIITSDWYRNLFPGMRIDPRKDTISEVRTTAGGYRLTTTVGGPLTGRGGDIVIIDDPIKAADSESEVARNNVNTWFRETVLSRLDDKTTGAIIIVMQRMHVDDLAGHVLEAGGWTHLDLPAISPQLQSVMTGPQNFQNFWEGDLLHPERDTKEVLDQLRVQMGTAAFSAQYLQRPIPAGGNMIKLAWFSRYDVLPERDREDHGWKIVQSWDTASKAGELNDHSVGITALVYKWDAIYILDVVRARLEYPDLKKRVIAARDKWKPRYVLIEDKGTGTSLIQELKRERIFCKGIKPDSDKVVRMSTCSAPIESGAVFLPNHAPWLDTFEHEILAFPKGRHDDQVDALSQLINWIMNGSRYSLDNIY